MFTCKEYPVPTRDLSKIPTRGAKPINSVMFIVGFTEKGIASTCVPLKYHEAARCFTIQSPRVHTWTRSSLYKTHLHLSTSVQTTLLEAFSKTSSLAVST